MSTENNFGVKADIEDFILCQNYTFANINIYIGYVFKVDKEKLVFKVDS